MSENAPESFVQEVKADADAYWTVLTTKGRKVFEGLEADARKFIADHYPRIHVEPGGADAPVADATLVSPDGKKEIHSSPETGFVPAPEVGA